MPGETDYTTITVTERCKERLDTERNGQPWSEFLEELRQEYADPITLNDAEEIAEHVSENVGADVDEGELALTTADYLMTEYNLAERVAGQIQDNENNW